MCWRFRVAVLAGLLVVPGGCWTKGDWLGFTPFPGARDLCEQRVYGTSGTRRVEIHWWSFATTVPTKDVISFYVKAEGKENPPERDGQSITVHRGADLLLSVHPAAGSDYPTCESKPQADEKTVIVVSRKTG